METKEEEVEEEKRQHGRVAIENYTHYVRVLGIFLSLVIVALYYLAEAVQVASSLVLVAWTEAAQNDLKIGDHHKYLLQYAGCASATLIISALYNASTYRLMARAS